jgi:uncharacterized protein (TIGR03083 family)
VTNLRPPLRIDTLHLFPEVQAALVDLLRGLDAEDWARPTVCAGWTVHDVALHLLGGELGNVSRRRDAWAFGPGPGRELVAWLNEWNEEWVAAARRLSPDVTTDLLAWSGQELRDYLATLDLDALGGPVGWAGPQPAPVWLDVAREYTERWLHQQHIRDAVRRPGLMDARHAGPVLATFVHALPHALGDVDRAPETAVTVRLEGVGAGVWSVVAGPEGWRLWAGEAPAPAATVTLDVDDAWRLWTRGADAGTFQSRIAGDQELGERVLRAVAIIA